MSIHDDMVTTNSAKIDVVLPAYNGSKLIPKALESALAQEVPLRIIVVDDGSTDDTAEVARSYGPQVTVIRQENRGVSGARNTGLAAATAPYVALLDQDDVWAPGKLARQLALIEAHPDVGIVFTDMRLEEPGGKIVEDGFLRTTGPYAALEGTPLGGNAVLFGPELGEAVVRFNFISPSTTLVRRQALQDIGGFDEAFRLCDDAECWMRLLVHSRGIAIEECLVLSLVWEGNASRKWGRMLAERLQMGEKSGRQPELFPPGTAAHFQRERPVTLYRIGVVDLNAGSIASARTHFRQSLQDKWSWSAAAGVASTLMPPFLRRGLLRAKRAAGIRWAIRVD